MKPTDEAIEVELQRSGLTPVADGDPQGLSDRDQTLGDADQTASDSDQTAADGDQAAAESDQAASDRDLVHGGDPAVHNLTRHLRDRNAQQRQHGSEVRFDTAADRDRNAEARDLAARARDQASELHDRRLAELEDGGMGDGSEMVGAGIGGRVTEDRERAVNDRLRAAEARGRAASDREYAARDREEAARDLSQARVDAALANRAKEMFLSSMRHELRTPLNAVLGFTGTLLMGLHGPLAEEQVAHLGKVRDAGRHLLALINSLLELARLASDETDLLLEPFDCRELLDEVAGRLRPLAVEKGLEFEVLCDRKPIGLACDRPAVIRILMNLAENAIESTDEGSVRIELDHRCSEDRWLAHFAVIDSGCGIGPEAQKQLLTALERSGSPDDRLPDGSGLGLYISESMAGLMGGRITFDSALGRGSTFVLELAGSVG